MPRIYLAGPEVFFTDAQAQAQSHKEMCRRHGLQGCFPTDAGPHDGATKRDIGKSIYRGNIELIDGCQAVIANMTPFRGPSMDVGTAFEIGYAVARNKPVFGWSLVCATTYDERVAEADVADKMLVEDYQMYDNLMVAVPLRGDTVHPSFAAAAAAASSHLKAGAA